MSTCVRRVLAVAVALSIAASACRDDEGATPDIQATTTAAAGSDVTTDADADAPVRGGTLVTAISSDPGHLNPAITTSGATHTAAELAFNGLVSLDDEGRPQPELAESWEIEEDGRRYTFTLRDDVVWHDGEPFTAADVVFTFQEMLLELHSRTAASVGDALESVEAQDEKTVVFRFTEPYAPFLQQLDVTEAPILPRHVYEGTDVKENPANNQPIGTGPFRVVSYAAGQEIRFERNEAYFEPDLPYLDAVVMRIIPDVSSQVAALERGEVDFLWSAPGPDRSRLLEDGQLDSLETAVNPGGSNCIMTVSYNLELPMFQDVRMRRAIAHALDRDQFVERVTFGEGQAAEAPISSGIPWAHADGLDIPEHDVARAEELLDELGWVRSGDGIRTAQGVEGVEDGTPLAFDFLHFPTFSAYGELLRAQLLEVGADVELRPFEPPVFVETVFTNRDFDTNVISYCNGPDPEVGVRRMYLSSNIGAIPFSNAAAYRNPRVDELFDQAQATVGLDERGEIYREIQEIAVEDLPYFWLVETRSTRIFRADCHDFQPAGHFAETAWCEE